MHSFYVCPICKVELDNPKELQEQKEKPQNQLSEVNFRTQIK
jgi:hypothetical protein